MNDKPYCICTKKVGSTKVGDDWVCGECRKPSAMWLEREVIPRMVLGSQEKLVELQNKRKNFLQNLAEIERKTIAGLAIYYNVPIQIIETVWRNR